MMKGQRVTQEVNVSEAIITCDKQQQNLQDKINWQRQRNDIKKKTIQLLNIVVSGFMK